MRTRRIILSGADLAIRELEQRFREAWIISQRLSSGLTLGYSNFWPEIRLENWQVYHTEDRAIKRRPPSSDEIDRLVQCMRWLRWVEDNDRQLIWRRASRMPWREIAKVCGRSNTSVRRYWHRAMLKIHIQKQLKASER